MGSLLTAACHVVLGRRDDRVTPGQAFSAWATRIIAKISLASGAIAILLSASRQAMPVSVGSPSVSDIWHAILPLWLAGMHIFYLWIVLRLLVFEVPSHRRKLRSIVIPLILILSYVSYALPPYRDQLSMISPWMSKVNFKLFSDWLFIWVYLLWAIRDCLEAAESPGYGKLLRKFWTGADLVIGAVMIADMIVSIPHPQSVSVKDLVVTACIGGYLLVWRTIIATQRIGLARLYLGYLDALESCAPIVKGNPSEINTALAPYGDADTLSILDFGSGDGRRLWWLLAQTGLLKTAAGGGNRKLRVLMYDKVAYWWDVAWYLSDEGRRELEPIRAAGWTVEVEHTTSFLEVVRQSDKFDMVHASHSVYDSKAFWEFGWIVRRGRSGCAVVVRGAGGSIFRRISESVCLAHPGVRNVNYLWSTHFVECVKRNELSYLTGVAESSCLVINQDIEDVTIIPRVRDLLEAIYSAEWTASVEDLCRASLRHEQLCGGLNNQDWILFLRKP